MTDYVKIKDELERLGWRGEQANGDHIKFRLEGNPRYIVLSMQVNSSARAFSNMVAQIRRVEPRFSLGRPAGWVPPETITAVAEQECEAAEESVAAAAQIGEYDKSYRKSKSWIKVGAEVTLDGKEGASNKVYGIVRRVGDELRIFTDDVHCFAIKDVINSLVIVK